MLSFMDKANIVPAQNMTGHMECPREQRRLKVRPAALYMWASGSYIKQLVVLSILSWQLLVHDNQEYKVRNFMSALSS